MTKTTRLLAVLALSIMVLAGASIAVVAASVNEPATPKSASAHHAAILCDYLVEPAGDDKGGSWN